MKLISWNVNGLRACMGKGFLDFFNEIDADVFCLQETKMQPDQLKLELEGYHQLWCSAQKKGYSGTAMFCKEKPLSVIYELPEEVHATEGRVIAAEFEAFWLVNVYVPNSQRGLTRLDYRMEWEEEFLRFVKELDEKKPVLICGDMNVAHREIDLKNPKTNVNNAGFTPQEREKMTVLQQNGFVDSFRYFYPDREGAYSWWSYMFHARENNAGWRIDYFLVSEKVKEKMKDAKIHADIMGSDHCPVELEIDFA
ncbi:MAG: exodeoxyribonuclease III [Oscillospiraceae bacterium]|nr:exodeoxyribonuclease III [Oscillospiraceae bacterium]